MIQMFYLLLWFHLFWASFIFSIYFLSVVQVISIFLFSGSLIHSSLLCILLLENTEFLISVTVLFVVMKHTYHKICNYDHFYVYNSEALGIFTTLCNHSIPTPEHFHHPEIENSVPTKQNQWVFFFYVPCVSAIIKHLSFCACLISLSMFWRLIHVAALYQNFILFQSWIIFLCMYIPPFIYPFICWWTSGLFPRFCYCVMLLWMLICKYFFFWQQLSNGYEVVLTCISLVVSDFSICAHVYWHVYIFFGEMSIQVLCQVLSWFFIVVVEL